jgi:hypothetical protein
MQPFATAAAKGSPSAFWRLVERGYAPPPEPELPVAAVLADGVRRGTAERLLEDLAPRTAGGLALFCPSFVSRCGETEHEAHAVQLMERMAELHAALPALPLAMFFGMQWAPGEEDEAVRRLGCLAEHAARFPFLTFVGSCVQGPGKMRNHNAALRLARPLGARGWIWVDDDVRLEPGCLAALGRRFVEKGFRGALGAVKVEVPKEQAVSRALRRVKAHTAPPRKYPTGGCMVVEAAVVAGGMPMRWQNDDGYIFFSLLDPVAEDPYHLLEIVPAARCTVQVGGPGGETVRNLRRNLYSHILFMASAPPGVAAFYFRSSLFHGLWPLAPWDGSRGARGGLKKWSLKLGYFVWFSATATGLAVRGLVRRPLRGIAWGAYSRYGVPSAAGRDAA